MEPIEKTLWYFSVVYAGLAFYVAAFHPDKLKFALAIAIMAGVVGGAALDQHDRRHKHKRPR